MRQSHAETNYILCGSTTSRNELLLIVHLHWHMVNHNDTWAPVHLRVMHKITRQAASQPSSNDEIPKSCSVCCLGKTYSYNRQVPGFFGVLDHRVVKVENMGDTVILSDTDRGKAAIHIILRCSDKHPCSIRPQRA